MVIRVLKAPLVLRPYHIVLLQMDLHITIWYRAGAAHPIGILIWISKVQISAPSGLKPLPVKPVPGT